MRSCIFWFRTNPNVPRTFSYRWAATDARVGKIMYTGEFTTATIRLPGTHGNELMTAFDTISKQVTFQREFD